MKQFLHDTLLSPENICNFNQQITFIKKAVEQKKKLVIYAPRNYGKTSILRNVIIPHFKVKNKKGFVFFCDLMEVKNLDNINQRVQSAFEASFSDSFKTKSKISAVMDLLTRLRPQVSLDPLTGTPSLSLSFDKKTSGENFQEVFRTIMSFAKQIPTFIVIDEFQDIASVDQAQGLFRQVFQEINNIPLILMGSKQHLLAEITALPKAPLAGFGEDLDFPPIPFKEYHQYIEERFEKNNLQIEFNVAKELQTICHRDPEVINIVCLSIIQNYSDCSIDRAIINNAIEMAVENRRSRFEQILASLTVNEEKLLVILAKNEPALHLTSRVFLSKTGLSARGLSLAKNTLFNKSLIDKHKKGFFVSDTLFATFIRKYR